jgi:hypothetical protein
MDSQPVPPAAGAQVFLSGSPSSAGFDQALTLVGKDVPVTLVGQGADGARLELPSGQTVTAKGSLPFPENTRLQVRVMAQDGSIRLQILEALPPPPAPILAPLAQGEAAAILRLLQASDLPDALLPLARLFADLAPSSEQELMQAIESLRPQARQSLASLLGLRDGAAAPILHALLESFDPVASLSEMAPLLLARQPGHAPTGDWRAAASGAGVPAESLRDLFVLFFRLDSVSTAGNRTQAQVGHPAESLLDELAHALKPLFGEPAEGDAEVPGEAPQPGAAKDRPEAAGAGREAGAQTGAGRVAADGGDGAGRVVADGGSTARGAAQDRPEGARAGAGRAAGAHTGAEQGRSEGAAAARVAGDGGDGAGRVVADGGGAARGAAQDRSARARAGADGAAPHGRHEGAGAARTTIGGGGAARGGAQGQSDGAAAARTAVGGGEGAGRGDGGSINSVIQALKSMPEAGQAQITDRTVALALLRLAVAALPREKIDAMVGEAAAAETAKGSQGAGAGNAAAARPGAPNAIAPAPTAEPPAGAGNAPEGQALPRDAGSRPGQAGARAPEDTASNAKAEPVPVGVGGGGDRFPPSGAGKVFAMLGQIAELLKGAEGGKEGADVAANASAENRGKSGGDSSGAVSGHGTQKPPQAPESQRSPEKGAAAAPSVPSAPADAARGSAAAAGANAHTEPLQRAGPLQAAAEPAADGANALGVRTAAPGQDVRVGRLADALGGADPDVEAAARALYRYLGASPKNAQGAVPEGGPQQTGEGPSAQAEMTQAAQAAQAIGRLPAPVRRALASAVLGFPEPDAKKIAETMMQNGGAPAARPARHELLSRLEASPTVVRQLVAMVAGLPPDAGIGKIAEALAGAGKGVIGAARGILSLKDGGGQGAGAEAGVPGPSRRAMDAEDRIGYLLRFEALGSQQAVPQHDRDGISAWFRSIVDLLMAARSARDGRRDSGQTTAPPPFPQGGGPARHAQAAPQGAAQAGERAQTWHSWLDGCVRALADPAATREAAFHSLAAKENVNYFELPLPWMPGRSLEMWVESDGDGNRRGKGDSGHRVLLGMAFSVLGETRVGIESAGKRLNVRIWAERIKPMESALPQLLSDLSALGFEAAVSLNALVPQGGPAPSIKSALGGQSLNAVG